MSYAFYVDSSACSGCKACQAACKDQNGLPVGLLWRRVYEICGGDWQPAGRAWVSDVFAYYLSISCNHCQQPICVEVCPALAMQQRTDGIVWIDAGRCVGCRYCVWACPYGAPQYDEEHGITTKCNFCAERLDQGLAPACVAACPMRALDFGEWAELEERYGARGDIFPLVEAGCTDPALVIQPHRQAARATPTTAQVSNWEEVKR